MNEGYWRHNGGSGDQNQLQVILRRSVLVIDDFIVVIFLNLKLLQGEGGDGAAGAAGAAAGGGAAGSSEEVQVRYPREWGYVYRPYRTETENKN